MELKEKYTRFGMALKRKLIQKAGLVSDQKYFLDSHFKEQRTKDVERVALYSDVCSVEYKQPINGNKVLNYYPPRYIYRLSEPIVDPISGLVYDSEGEFIAESSSWRPLRLLYSWPKPKVKTNIKKLKGEYLFLPNEGYFHWLLQDLPAFIGALEEYPDTPVLVFPETYSFVKAFLKSLPNEIIPITKLTKVESLIMVGKTAGQGNPLLGATLHPQDVQTVKNYFKKYISSSEEDKKKIYLSRVGYRRSPANEIELENKLKERGFEIFNANSGLDLFQQVNLFAQAETIVAVHGAALANLVWCKEKIKVIELFPSAYIPACYSILSSCLNIDYKAISHGKLSTDPISTDTMKVIMENI
jgi:hypothetical protein